MRYLNRSVALLAAFLMARVLLRRLSDPDFWWHLSAARAMVENGALLRTDIFSHTLAGAPWINFEWFGGLLLYGVFAASGLYGVLLIKILLGLLSVGLLARLIRRQGAAGGVLLALTVFGFVILSPRLLERPEIFTLVFMPAGLLLLQPGAGGWRRLAVWAGLLGVWANTHGGFLYGLSIPVLLGAGAWWSGKADARNFYFKALLAGFAATLVNPYGSGIYGIFAVHARALAFSQVQAGVIGEWLPSTLRNGPFFWALYLLALAGLFAAFRKERKAALLWVPAVFVYGVWGTFHMRNMALFPFFALPFLGALLNEEELARHLPALKTRRALDGALAVLALALFISVGPALLRGWPKDPVAEARFPRAALRFAEENKIEGKLYNTYHFGGFIEWASGGKRPVFWDGRYIFGNLIVDAVGMEKALLAAPRKDLWPGYLARWGVDYAIVEPFPGRVQPDPAEPDLPATSYEAMFPWKKWALVFWDDAALVFVKRGPEFDALIRREEYTVLKPHNAALTLALAAAGPAAMARAERELARHRAIVPRSYLRNRLEAELNAKDIKK